MLQPEHTDYENLEAYSNPTYNSFMITEKAHTQNFSLSTNKTKLQASN